MATLLLAKTNRVFLSMALAQAHEQNSADINSDGGAVGLTQSPEALRRWVVAGPELVMMTSLRHPWRENTTSFWIPVTMSRPKVSR